jgi:hypothetical protein
MQSSKHELFPPVPWEMFTSSSDGDDKTFDDEKSDWRGYPCGAVAGGNYCF